MRVYYDQRAREYDGWWLGTGQFERRDPARRPVVRRRRGELMPR
jgi:hypothetical protein